MSLFQLLYHTVFIHQLQLCPPNKDLYGLGAGNTCGTAGDILSDNAKRTGRVLATVVLDSHIGAVSIKVIVLPVEGDVVATPIDRAGAVACIAGALPTSFLTSTCVVAVQFDTFPRIVELFVVDARTLILHHTATTAIIQESIGTHTATDALCMVIASHQCLAASGTGFPDGQSS